jgi:hypothetical protein
MTKTILKMGVVGLVVMSFTACQKDPLKSLSAEESRIYITNHDSTADFSSFKTFSIADSVVVIEDNQGLGKELSTYDAAVIDAVKSSMQQRGYQLVPKDQEPDLGINVSRVYNNYTGVMSYPSYWDYYGSYYDPFYWGYGGYNYYDPIYYGPSYYSYYQVTQGALTVDILNLRDAKNDNTIRPVWSALARGQGVFGVGNAQGHVNMFFEQSPYLLTNQ